MTHISFARQLERTYQRLQWFQERHGTELDQPSQVRLHQALCQMEFYRALLAHPLYRRGAVPQELVLVENTQQLRQRGQELAHLAQEMAQRARAMRQWLEERRRNRQAEARRPLPSSA